MEGMSDDTLHIKQQWELELNTVTDEDTRGLEGNTGV